MERTRGKKVWSFVGNLLFYTLVVAILVATVLYTMSPNSRKSIFGYRFYEALTSSMSPAIHQGDLILVKMATPEQVKPGDIITCAADETGEVTVTHRLVETYTDSSGELMLVTQGDTNTETDDPIHHSRMIGVAVNNLPAVGFIIGKIQANPLLVLLPGIAIVTLILCGRYMRKHKRHEQINTSEKETNTCK